MSGGTANLLTALFVAAAAAVGYPSRRSPTDLDATPRTTVTFDGKRSTTAGRGGGDEVWDLAGRHIVTVSSPLEPGA